MLLSMALCGSVKAQNKYLPNPDVNLETVPTGSYVIAMGNSLQTNTAGYFNLKTYGLITHLLNNNKKLKWVIKGGKAKDGIDFTVPAEQIQPTYAASVSRDFRAGPFVIYAADTTGVAALINSFYTANALSGNDRPKVYRLTAPVIADIRFDMTGFKPKVAILDDGNNTDIHLNYMMLCSIPSYNYTTGFSGLDLLTKCFTFASEPHNDGSSNATIAAIKKFVQYGGNFLAQCRAVEAYENNIEGRFCSTTGIEVKNTNVSPLLTVYPHADLTFTQFEGLFDIEENGSVKNWLLKAGSSFINNEHNHSTGGTIVNQLPIGSSVSKLTAPALPGGLVFYLGNHEFENVSSIVEINGIRMYMNAMLTPNAININCNTGEYLANPLPVKLLAFNATLDQDQSKANLNWITATEMNADYFVIERSLDGNSFSDIGKVQAFGNTNEHKNYEFADNINSVNAPVVYYRLRQVDIDGKAEYSATRIIRTIKQTENNITILAYPNPVSNELRVTIPENWQNKRVTYELFKADGQVAIKIETPNSTQTETISTAALAPGFYFMRVNCEGEIAQQKIVKN